MTVFRTERKPAGEGLAFAAAHGQAGPMISEGQLRGFAESAEAIAGRGRAAALAWLEKGFSAQDKNEGGAFDPVTEADRAAEQAMREWIEAEYPDHGIIGEEFGEKPSQSPWSWSLDPIDGTRAFICGMPGWTVLVALLHEGRPVIGIVDVPRLDERYVGYQGRAFVRRGGMSAAIRVSGCARLGEARLSTTDPHLFAGEEAEGFERLRRTARLTRYGYDAYAYARLAAGWIDLVVESGLKPHDYNALIPLVRAAGGAVTNWRGDEDFSGGHVVAAASHGLLEETVALLAERSPTS